MANEQQKIIDQDDIKNFYETYVPERVETLLKTKEVNGNLDENGNIKVEGLSSSTSYIFGAFSISQISDKSICLIPFTSTDSSWNLHVIAADSSNTIGTTSNSIEATIYYIDIQEATS